MPRSIKLIDISPSRFHNCILYLSSVFGIYVVNHFKTIVRHYLIVSGTFLKTFLFNRIRIVINSLKTDRKYCLFSFSSTKFQSKTTQCAALSSMLSTTFYDSGMSLCLARNFRLYDEVSSLANCDGQPDGEVQHNE